MGIAFQKRTRSDKALATAENIVKVILNHRQRSSVALL